MARRRCARCSESAPARTPACFCRRPTLCLAPSEWPVARIATGRKQHQRGKRTSGTLGAGKNQRPLYDKHSGFQSFSRLFPGVIALVVNGGFAAGPLAGRTGAFSSAGGVWQLGGLAGTSFKSDNRATAGRTYIGCAGVITGVIPLTGNQCIAAVVVPANAGIILAGTDNYSVLLHWLAKPAATCA